MKELSLGNVGSYSNGLVGDDLSEIIISSVSTDSRILDKVVFSWPSKVIILMAMIMLLML